MGLDRVNIVAATHQSKSTADTNNGMALLDPNRKIDLGMLFQIHQFFDSCFKTIEIHELLFC